MQILTIGRKKRVHAIAFSPTGQELAAACGDGLLRIWDLATGQVRQSVSINETPGGCDLAYLGQDRIVLSGIDLSCWDLAANRRKVIEAGLAWGRRLRISPDGHCLAEVDQTTSTQWAGSGLVLHDCTSWTDLPTAAEPDATTGGLAFSPDGRWLATGHIVRVGERMRHFHIIQAAFPVPEYDYVVHLREWPSAGVVRSLAGWQQGVSHLAFSPRGPVLAGTAGPRLRIWDFEGDRELALHKRGPKHFQGLAFSADGGYLATVSNDETVRLWETTTWQEHTTFTWGIGKLLNIAFAPDGFRAAAGSDRGQVILWDVDD